MHWGQGWEPYGRASRSALRLTAARPTLEKAKGLFWSDPGPPSSPVPDPDAPCERWYRPSSQRANHRVAPRVVSVAEAARAMQALGRDGASDGTPLLTVKANLIRCDTATGSSVNWEWRSAKVSVFSFFWCWSPLMLPQSPDAILSPTLSIDGPALTPPCHTPLVDSAFRSFQRIVAHCHSFVEQF